MNLKDSLLALTVIAVWGVNFFFMKIALDEVSPMVLGMLRFALILLPAVFLLKRPAVPWYWLAAYGATISFGQFSLMFTALSLGMPTGLAALLLQGQVFFTVFLAAVFFREPVQPNHLLGIVGAAAGLLLIGVGQYRGSVPLLAMWPVLGAAACWAAGNIVVKYIGRVNALSLVVWGNISALLLFGVCAFWFYGAEGVQAQLAGLSWRGIAGVVFLAYVASLVGYAGWGGLLSRYPAAQITPLALLVPVVALLVARVWLNEEMNGWHWSGVIVVMAALLIHVFGGRYRGRLKTGLPK
ncbi:EamA family transporter [Uruburuella testudinis]|uniref:EamA family transporter n=1 Tax=Uruburuella testudinis TaxID=1282863 RepID=A0ABY4DUI7_9NEIS|nr:EamA family transporter [Uruburuella testudinis]UOO81282.1 EamA family transporter [Uruburuella testudinis]